MGEGDLMSDLTCCHKRKVLKTQYSASCAKIRDAPIMLWPIIGRPIIGAK